MLKRQLVPIQLRQNQHGWLTELFELLGRGMALLIGIGAELFDDGINLGAELGIDGGIGSQNLPSQRRRNREQRWLSAEFSNDRPLVCVHLEGIL